MKIGIDLGGTNLRVGVVKDGVVQQKIAESCKADQSEKEILDHLIAMTSRLITPEVKSIGIGVPSVVDAAKGIVYNVANIPSWKEVWLKDILEKEFKIPVAVNNDCNCFALGEVRFGEGKPYKDIICMSIGTGVGAGIIANGQLYCGNNTGAGEIGSFPYRDYEFEAYCSSHFFVREYSVTGKEAYERACENEAFALRLWDELGVHIGNLLQTVLFAYDPQAIIMGGSISQAFRFFSKKMYERLDHFPYPETVRRLNIHLSKNEDSALLGASELL